LRRRLTPAQQKNIIMMAGKCLSCGEKDIRVLDVHHIKPFSKGGSNKPSNLTVLCGTCHRKADRGLIRPRSLLFREQSPSKGEPKDKPFLLLRFQESVQKPIESDWSIRLLYPKEHLEACTIFWKDGPLPWWDPAQKTYQRLIIANGGGNVRIPKGWEADEDTIITVKDGENVLMTRKFSELPIVSA